MRTLLIWVWLGTMVAAVASCGGGGATAPAEPATAAPAAAAPQGAAAIQATGPVTCPATVPVAQTLTAPQSGWESFEDEAPAQLMFVSVFDGHPRERASLVPDGETDAGGKRVTTWRLTPNAQRRYWIACYYDRSRIVLTRMLAPEASSLEVTRDPQASIAGQPVISSMSLR